jgi:hypothetical protein
MMRALILAALVAGCSDPTFTLRFQVTQGAADACPDNSGSGSGQATQCEQVKMSCAAVVSIRVFNPNTPTSPVISVCQELMMASTPTLCEIAQVSLPPPTSPVEAQTLEVEILVYPKNKLQLDANLAPICPAMVDIGVDGFPTPSLVPCLPEQACDPAPAVGGIAFYHPGDAETVVELGCADIGLLNDQVCTGPATGVTASVTDFDTLVSVPISLASHLDVEIGTPSMVSTATTFASSATLMLGTATVPTWTGSITATPDIACIQVDETDVAARTDSVRCKEAMAGDPTPDAFVGTRLAKATLDNILNVLGLPEFPDAGLVVGIVLDEHGNPASGLQVTADMVSSTVPTIKYLSTTRTSVGGTVTSASGIFLSTDAPFGTEFSAIQNGEMAKAVGGLIVGKVTIVVLQIPSQSPT